MIKEAAKKAGADACGIAPISRMNGAPDDMNPKFLFPKAKSMIGFVFRIPRGVQRGIEEGTQFFQYQGKRTETDRRSKLLRLALTGHTADHCSSVCDRFIDSRRADHFSIINDRDLFSYICAGGISKSFCTLVCQSQLYNPFFVLHAVLLNTCFCGSNL